MKFLRTESEIYDIDDLYVADYLTGKPYCTKDGNWCIYRESIIKKSNDFLELCDAFVVFLENGLHRIYDFNEYKLNTNLDRKTFLDELVEKYSDNVIKIAMWSKRGLIFVATKDEKGEFVLL